MHVPQQQQQAVVVVGQQPEVLHGRHWFADQRHHREQLIRFGASREHLQYPTIGGHYVFLMENQGLGLWRDVELQRLMAPCLSPPIQVQEEAPWDAHH